MYTSEAQSLKRMSKMTPEELKDLFGLQQLPASVTSIDLKNLPDEDLNEFSYDGLDFEEAANQLYRHILIMHYHAGTYNRQSEWFPTACAQLEKDLRLAGSFCLTKAVLEQKGMKFEKLENMEISSFYGMTSFYFRKCGKAFEDIYATAGMISIRMHEWERRWYLLGEQLKATQDKIDRILEGKISADTLLKRCEMFRPEVPDPVEKKPAKDPKSLVLTRGALPLLTSYAREALRERKQEAREQYIHERIEARKKHLDLYEAMCLKEERKEAAEPALPLQEQPAIEENVPEGDDGLVHIRIPVLRQQMMEEARAKGDTALMMEIAGEPPEKLAERFKQRLREKRAAAAAKAARRGPADGTRKKLREKRKKKKG